MDGISAWHTPGPDITDSGNGVAVEVKNSFSFINTFEIFQKMIYKNILEKNETFLNFFEKIVKYVYF